MAVACDRMGRERREQRAARPRRRNRSPILTASISPICSSLSATRQDRTAYAELFGYYAPRVKSYLMRLGADNAQAEEIAQDVMVTVWRKAVLFDRKQASVSTWIFRVARNRRIDVFRRTKRPDLDPEEEMILPPASRPPDARVETMETEVRVREAMKGPARRTAPAAAPRLLRGSFPQGDCGQAGCAAGHGQIPDKAGLRQDEIMRRLSDE